MVTKSAEDIQRELNRIQELRIKAEKEYKETLESGFKSHEPCCIDICNEVNSLISKLKSINEDLKSRKEKAPTKLQSQIRNAISSSEDQMKSLTELREQLYAKAICNCK